VNEMVRKNTQFFHFPQKLNFYFFQNWEELRGIGKNTHLIIFHSISFHYLYSFHFILFFFPFLYNLLSPLHYKLSTEA
jgi:hypothetical protein